ncbi:Uncharacterised protein [Bordetella pertussis]|nr:Uncharacterised protein [Bordetella pertussis]
MLQRATKSWSKRPVCSRWRMVSVCSRSGTPMPRPKVSAWA